jgi:hypothetical protein
VTLTIVRDGDDDGASETIIMDFGTVVNAGTQNPVTRTYTILDDDP